MTNSDLEYNVQNICKITWSDKDTDERITSITEDAIVHMHDLAWECPGNHPRMHSCARERQKCCLRIIACIVGMTCRMSSKRII